jgi:hypothetical protein
MTEDLNVGSYHGWRGQATKLKISNLIRKKVFT